MCCASGLGRALPTSLVETRCGFVRNWRSLGYTYVKIQDMAVYCSFVLVFGAHCDILSSPPQRSSPTRACSIQGKPLLGHSCKLLPVTSFVPTRRNISDGQRGRRIDPSWWLPPQPQSHSRLGTHMRTRQKKYNRNGSNLTGERKRDGNVTPSIPRRRRNTFPTM